MPSFRILSKSGDGLPIANTLQDEGHEVTAYIEHDKDPKDKDAGSYKDLYDGIIEKVDYPTDGITKDTIVICDMTGIKYHKDKKDLARIHDIEENDAEKFISLETWGDYFRSKGHKVIGGGKINDAMELDRGFGLELARSVGFRVPTESEFTDYNDALKFVRDTKKRYVLKPSGSKESYSVYPSRDWQDLATQLIYLIEKKVPADKIILQEFTEGVQMGIEGTWNGENLVGFNSTFEHKRLLAGHTGPLTGETGSVVYYYPDDKSKLPQMVKKLEPYLKKIDFPMGQIDCNFIINEEGAWFLEFTPRFGYPFTYISLFACKEWGTTFELIAEGVFDGFEVKKDKFFGGVNLYIPEYPFGRTRKDLVESPTFFQRIKSEHLDRIAFIDAKVKDGELVTGGTYGNLMCVTGSGESPKEVNKNIVSLIKEIEIYPVGYRNDIGLELDDDIKSLQEWGYFTPETV